MKIIICTTPIRPAPSDYPPFGAMAVIQSLRKDGWNPVFYDIDACRPNLAQVERFMIDSQPDVVGISAVVSTAYSYTKRLAQIIRRSAPEARIIVGGNLAASAEILHRLAGVDYCVIGEGDLTIRDLAAYLAAHPQGQKDEASLDKIPGLTYLKGNGDMAFTGLPEPVPAEQLYEPDYSILEKHSRIENFFLDPLSRPEFVQDPRSREPHRLGRKATIVLASKGCVSRCTFCHRWDKGYRVIPVRKIMAMVRFLKEKYNVGFFYFGDENFGSDRRHLTELLEALRSEDILYAVCGVRARSVTPEILRRMRESGCVAVYYGMESGSPDILEVMEKKTRLQDNDNAVIWTKKAGLYTIYQIVLGMPGETPRTVQETTDFLKRATAVLDEPPIRRLSINYVQALPGTPVYEYARRKGLIGASLADEERYLLEISDTNAADDTKFINFTGYDYLAVQSWRRKMILEVIHHYRQIHSLPRPRLRLLPALLLSKILPRWHRAAEKNANDPSRDDYFNLQPDLGYKMISAYLYPIRNPVIWLWLLFREFRRLPLRTFLRRFVENLGKRFRLAPPPMTYRSLRQILKEECTAPPDSPTERSMSFLRESR